MQPDPFKVLGLPARFDLSRDEIERAYLARAAAVHPDLAGDESHDASSALNAARTTLASPLARAEVLLALRAGGVAPGDKSLPAGFLAEFMPLREEGEEALARGDRAEVERLRAWGMAERSRFSDVVRGLFAEPALDAARLRTTLNAWRYIERLLERLDAGPR
ncbi:MAG: iron-sulfur cluster co-chaperone HscB C-terminal domain-containing protein [Planctomycetota bacterium]|nr:iron-sulfur cluster co-chaperone HscB C-terminal domain-containing protein [Planctomycetota bacterium]